MKNKIIVVVALVAIVAAAYWAFDSIRERSYSGSQLSFMVGSGSVMVTNHGSETIPVEMRAAGRAATFRVESSELELRQSSKRQGTGRDAYQAVAFDLPPGSAQINVTRGSNVWFVSGQGERLSAVVTPMAANGVRMTVGFAAFVILASLFYISRTTEHRWVSTLRGKLPGAQPDPKRSLT